MVKKYQFESIKNFCDIGGFNTPYGILKYNRIICGELPNKISKRDEKKLNTFDLEIIDLKKESNIEYFKNSYNKIDSINLEDYNSVLKILNIINKSQKTIFINYDSKTDNIDTIIMLIMMICNIQERDIISNYISLNLEENNKQNYKKMLNLFRDKYQTIDNYLNQISFINKNQLINKLIEL